MPDKTLKKAAGLFHTKKFQEVIKLLEPLVFQYRDNFSFYYFLGTACLYINDLGGAFSYLNRALQLKKDNINCLLGLAAIHLKRRETDKSLQIWLDILEKTPGQRIAQRGLDLIRKSNTPGELFDNKRRLEGIYPPVFNSFMALKRLSLFLFLLFVIGSIGFAVYKYLPNVLKNFAPRSELPDMTLSENNAWLGANAVNPDAATAEDASLFYARPYFIYNTEEVKKYFNNAKDYFLNYRENLAQVEVNRLLLSNASPEIKEKMKVLQKYIKKPDFTSLKDSFTYQEVVKEPLLYQNCYIIWKGKLANLNIKKDKITFDFLVNYHLEEELAGTVPVTLYFAANIKNGDNLELLGKVTLNNDHITLEGVSVHKLITGLAK